MLTQSDDTHQTYEMTKLYLQYYNDQLCQIDSQRRLRVHKEDMALEQYLKTLQWEAKQRKKGMLAHMKKEFVPGQLPGGCLTPCDVITECYGMSYAGYMSFPRRVQGGLEMKAFKTTLVDLPSPSLPTDLPKGEDFSRSRLHDEPGLTDRKRPKVQLPRVDSWRTSTVSDDLVVVAFEAKNTEREHMWVKTKSNAEFGVGKMEDVVLGMFPRRS